MAKHLLNKLDHRTVLSIKTPGRHSDGGGLYLSVDAEGRRRWVFMYTRSGKRTELGLGGGRDMSLAAARKQAAQLRVVLSEGKDPRASLAKSASKTFGQCADEYVAAMSPAWRNPKHRAQWVMTLTKYALPLRHRMVDTIDTEDVLSVLRARWQRTPETAERLRGRIENVLDAARAQGLRSGDNPARWKGHLDQLLPVRKRLSRGHHPALQYQEMPAFMPVLRKRSGVAAAALEMAILTAARTNEIIGATWDEVELEAAIWTIPANRMKAGKMHRVPLVPRAIAILHEMDGLRASDTKKGSDPLFPSEGKQRPLSNMAMSMLLRRIRPGVTVHGFRSTFRDWASEKTDFPFELCEMALAHTIANKSEAAYRRGDMLDRRRDLMDAWANFIWSAK